MMCARSRGMSYFAARYRTRVADDWYIDSVYQSAPCAAKPSCSRPIECVLVYQLPACQATFLLSTWWAMCPSLERKEYCQDTYSGSVTRASVVSQVASVSWITM